MRSDEELDKNFKDSISIFIILLIVGLIFSCLMAIEFLTSEKIETGKQIPCYDNYNNKINNITCKEMISCGIISNLIKVGECGKQ